MKLIDFYNRNSQYDTFDLSELVHGMSPFPELNIPEYFTDEEVGMNKRLKIRVLLKYYSDDRRFVKIMVVEFLEDRRKKTFTPFMLVMQGGREGNDAFIKKVSNSVLYHTATRYIQTLLPINELPIDIEVDSPFIEIPKLDQFYGSSMYELFKLADFKREKEND